VALRSDGVIVTWGPHAPRVPPDPGYTQAEAAYFHVVAVRQDGSVLAWGDNQHGQCDVPALPPGTTALKATGGIQHSAALLSDGSVLAWGSNSEGQCDVPPLPPGLRYVDVSANGYFTIGLVSDGSVVAWGSDLAGQTQVPALPPGLAYVEVAAGQEYGLALRSDGEVIGWGSEAHGQASVPALPPGYSYSALGAGAHHGLALRESPFPCGAVKNFCPGHANTTGSPATIGVWGSLDIQDDDTHLWTAACPPGRLGLFIYGADSAHLPFGDGILCISPFHPGLLRLGSVVTIDAGGHADHQVDFASLPPAGQIAAGSLWYFQLWYRDYTVGGSGANLSDAVRVTFCP
jgi:hypothetical protein